MNPNITFSVEEFGTGGMNSGRDRLAKFYTPTKYEYSVDEAGYTVFGGPRKKIHDVNSQRNYRNKNRDKLREDASKYYETMSPEQKSNWKKQMALINKNHRLNKKAALLTTPIKESGDKVLMKQLEKQLNRDWLALANSLTKQGVEGYSKSGRKSKKYNEEKKLFFASAPNNQEAEKKIKNKMRSDIDKGRKEIEEEREKLIQSGVIRQRKDKNLTDELQYKINDGGDRVSLTDNSIISYLEPEYEEVALAPKGSTNTSLNLKGLQTYYDNFLKPDISDAEKKQLLKTSKNKLYSTEFKPMLDKLKVVKDISKDVDEKMRLQRKIQKLEKTTNPFIPQ